MRRSLAITILLALLTAVAPRLEAKVVEENWYTILLEGERAGHMVDRLVHDDESDAVTSTQQMNLTIRRAGVTLKIMTTTAITERDGKVASMTMTQSAMGNRSIDRYEITDDAVTHTRTNAGRSNTVELPPIEDDYLTPTQAAEFVEQKLKEGAETFTYASLSPDMGLKPAEITTTVLERTVADIAGVSRRVVRTTSSLSILPDVKPREVLSEEGEMLETTIDMGGLSLTLQKTDKAYATADFDPAEMFISTLIGIRPGVPDARDTTKAKYKITPKKNADLPSFPSAGIQTAQATQDEVIVVLDLAKNHPVSVDELTPYLTASNEIDPTDPIIVSLAEQAMQHNREQEDQAEIALAMTDFVSAYVTQKDLSQGFATASEVARSKQGDCTEHAVLLAAMLRVAEVPSRIAFGLVYLEDPHSTERDGFFGFHAWTQALITRADGQTIWQDFDAAIPSERGFDAAHILLSTTPLADDAESVPAMLSIVQAIGTIDIEVVETAP